MVHYVLWSSIVTVKVVDTHHRRSPLVQGGLEIPVIVMVQMEHNTQNKVGAKEL